MTPVVVVGTVGGEVFGSVARDAVATADVLVGAPRHLEAFPVGSPMQRRTELVGPLPPLIDAMDVARRAGLKVCVLSSGDPGFFGITRLLVERFGPRGVCVLPAPSSVSLAWAAAGRSWDDATVVSAHGRSLDRAADEALRSAKVAVLTSPTNPPEAVGAALLARRCGPREVVVVSRLGERDQRIAHTDVDGLAAGSFDPMSVVLLVAPGGPSTPTVSWGGHEDEFDHRSGMITKAEVRAVVLSKLQLPRVGTMWDVGAGSGSVGIEAATVSPGLRICAVERAAEDASRIRVNAERAGVDVNVDVVIGVAPDVLAGLPAPDRVFVGGGGIGVVEACWQRLAANGVLVATFVVLDHAMAAHRLLGEMVQLHVDRVVPIGASGSRLQPENPVFVCWGRR